MKGVKVSMPCFVVYLSLCNYFAFLLGRHRDGMELDPTIGSTHRSFFTPATLVHRKTI